MKLDPRIKSLSDILTIFDIDRAKQFIGKKGYFATALYCYHDLSHRWYGTLENVFDSEGRTFTAKENDLEYAYFIPESSLKPIEKKYRPYTLGEFSSKFAIGAPVVFRSKGEPTVVWTVILTGYRQEEPGGTVFMGVYPYKLDELFKVYERYEDETGDWVPFGVEAEE